MITEWNLPGTLWLLFKSDPQSRKKTPSSFLFCKNWVKNMVSMASMIGRIDNVRNDSHIYVSLFLSVSCQIRNNEHYYIYQWDCQFSFWCQIWLSRTNCTFTIASYTVGTTNCKSLMWSNRSYNWTTTQPAR